MQKNINRRGFLQNSTLISAGLFFASAGFSSFTGEGNKTSNHPENSYSNKKKRKIGSLEVSAIGLGCMSMAGVYNAPQDKGEMVKVIRQAYENGVDFLIPQKCMDLSSVKKSLVKPSLRSRKK